MTETPDPLDDLAIGYVLPTDEETAEIWDRAIIALDANVLLNVYRYSPEARDDLLSAFAAMGDRLFVPHQAAREYFHRRVGVLTEQLTAKDQMSAAIDKAIDEFVRAVTTTHRSLGRRDAPEEVTSKIHDKLTKIREEFLTAEGERLSDTEPRSDEIHDRLVGVIRGHVGRPYDDKRVASITAEMTRRYAARIPPGYMDGEKEDGGLGDLLVWNQLLDKAAETKRPIVLVTDDTKEDWVWEIRGRTIGPRPELVREMHTRAGIEFLLYTTSRFLEFVAANEKAEISQAALEEAKAQESPSVAGPGALVETSKLATLGKALEAVLLGRDLVTLVVSTAGRSAKLRAATWSQDGGELLCRVVSEDGNVWAMSASIGHAMPLDVVFPDDFGSQRNPPVGPGRYTAHWRFVTNGEQAPTGRIDEFVLV